MSRTISLTNVIGLIAGLGLIFQIGHFLEHTFQEGIWVFDLSQICGRDKPWMSPWVTDMVEYFGLLIWPTADTARRMMLSMELLHLVGNSIFLISLICLYYCIPSKWVKWAIYIETFHLYEHIMLTLSAIFVGKPIGLSTLFGGTYYFGPKEFIVGYRVSWHFVMNLLPMPFAMVGLMQYLNSRRRSSNGISIS